jgi:drug/metabolite transporter (DMT)-like permease
MLFASPALLAVLCLVASGLLDLVFKLYAAKPRSRGMLIFGIGCVWVVLQGTSMSFGEGGFDLAAVTLGYGVAAAIFVTVSNILLLECLTHLPISMASTIYRLNTIPLVILAFFVLGESLDGFKLAGILAGVATVFLLYRPDRDPGKHDPHFVLFLALIILASIIRALYGIATKAGVDSGGDPDTMMLLAAFGWCSGGLAYAHFRERRVVITRAKLAFIAVAGALVFAIVWLLTTALTLGDASVVVPLANMGFVAAFVFSVMLRLERLDARKLAAVALAIVAVVLLSQAS